MGDPWVSGVPTVGGTTTGSRSVVEVLASVEALEKEGYVTGLRAKRIRTRIGRLVVHAIARQPQPLKGGTMSHDSRSPQEMRGSASTPTTPRYRLESLRSTQLSLTP